MTQAEPPSHKEFSFASFRLLRDEWLLLKGEEPVRLGGRALEILTALVERPGTVVTKEELFARVWPKQFVEEGNLKLHVAALRKALDDGQGDNRFIVNIPGRGYCFVAAVESSDRKPPPDGRAASTPESRLPTLITRIVGRSDTIVALATQLPQYRFISIVGPGGVGKTTVAIAVADALRATFADGVRFIDLGPIGDPSHVPSALAAALGASVQAENELQGLISFLKDQHILVVLDNCEHVIEIVAALAEGIVRHTRGTSILATSREPLRADGEHVHRLGSLAVPPMSEELTAAQALAFPAVQLFVERAVAAQDTFELTDAEAPVVAELCRHLDGIALAIEIAAGRVDTFNVAQLASGLDDRRRLMMRGRRTSLSRHQTLSATLDWSYQLLPEIERAALQGLAIFAGAFTWNSASAVLKENDRDVPDVFDSIVNLVGKSLVSAIVEEGQPFYKLLDTTRAYALLKLEQSGAKNAMARRHAQHFLAVLTQAKVEWDQVSAAEWRRKYWRTIDNVRAALDWAFSTSGDAGIGVALTEAASPLWFQLSLMSECGKRVEHALIALSTNPDPLCEMHLQAALASSLMQTAGSDQARPAWAVVLRLAEDIADIGHQLRALWGLWAASLNSAQLKSALSVAERFRALAETSSDPNDELVGDRMLGYTLHLLGDQSSARSRLEHMLANYVVPTTGPRIIRFVFDQLATGRSLLARVLWLQGFPDQAGAAAQRAIEEAKGSGDMLTVCQVLVQAACPISILTGDYQRLETQVDSLLEYSTRNSLGFWRVWGRCFKAVQTIKSGHVADGLIELRMGMDELRKIRYGVYYIVFLCEYADALSLAGQSQQGLLAIEEALKRGQNNEENWYVAELLRVKGELMLRLSGADAAPEAMKLFQLSLDWSRQQGALSWELRTAISLTRLHFANQWPNTSLNLLRTIFNKFTEGFKTADLALARRLLDETPAGMLPRRQPI
jgi:predicted ATPase/DNA-binding winged helix-turn-helix (wHTH) protein